jgi:hypothetical protein
MSNSSENVDIIPLFHRIDDHFEGKSELYTKSGGGSSNSANIEKLIQDIDLCTNLVHKLGLFSKNEDVDDYSTLSIKVSSSSFIIAVVF